MDTFWDKCNLIPTQWEINIKNRIFLKKPWFNVLPIHTHTHTNTETPMPHHQILLNIFWKFPTLTQILSEQQQNIRNSLSHILKTVWSWVIKPRKLGHLGGSAG